MSPLQAGILQQAVQGTLMTATRSVYLQHTDTWAIAEESLQSHSYHIHHRLMQQVPSKGMLFTLSILIFHSIKSELLDECAEPSQGSAETGFSQDGSISAAAWSVHTLPDGMSGGQDGTKRLNVGPGACRTASIEVLAG